MRTHESFHLLSFLSEEALGAIHGASLRILEEIGVRVHHETILAKLGEAGAIVNAESLTARLPTAMVLSSLQTCGKTYALYGRDRGKKAAFGQGEMLFLCSGGQFAWVDPITKVRRDPTIADARRAIKVADALENINIVGALALPAEVDPKVRDVVLWAELIRGTTKPMLTWMHSREAAVYVLEMLETVAGSAKELQTYPMTFAFVEPISPLQFTKEGMDLLLEFSRRGLPVGFGPMAMSMATAPATLAGTIAQGNAEVLAGITISQVLKPGLPVCYWGIPHIMDARTGNISFGSSEQALMAVALVELARGYGVPVGVNVGLTDAKVPDAQAGLEKGMTLLLGALAGADIFGHMGISGAGQGVSLPQLVIDNEMAGYVRRLNRGFAVDEETIAFDVIRRVGIAGQFLTDEHTLRTYRGEQWVSELFDRKDWQTWVESGSTTVLERAAEQVDKLAATHSVPPLAPEVEREIARIIKSAERHLLAKKIANQAGTAYLTKGWQWC